MFIIFEGPDGVGKTTLMNMVNEKLTNDGLDILLTREPGGTSLGSKIRKILFDPNEIISKEAETLLFLADRAENNEKVIKPALEKGKIVISDRYDVTTFVYQSYYKKAIKFLDLKRVESIFKFLIPDFGVFVIADKPHRKDDVFLNKWNPDWNDLRNYYMTLASELEHDFYNYPKLIIDTTDSSVEKNAEIIVSAIKTELYKKYQKTLISKNFML